MLFGLIFCSSAKVDARTLVESYMACSRGGTEEVSEACLQKNKVTLPGCRTSWNFSCSAPIAKELVSDFDDHCLLSMAGDSQIRSVYTSLKTDASKNVCRIQSFEFQKGDKTSFFIPIGHAKLGKDGKWVVPPPQIPIALRTFITPKNIVVNEITQREPFLLGKGRHYEAARDSDICNPTFRSFTHRPGKLNDGTVHVYFSLRDPDEVEAANAVSKSWELEQSDDFLRNDRHVIGRSRDFYYTVVSAFTPKNDLKICGRTIPKGTILRLSTYLNPKMQVCEIAADGVLFLLGVPNTEKKSEPGKEPTKTLTCVPKAYFSGNFKHAMNKYISSKNSGKAEVPTKPLVDFNDCECMAKELEPEEWRD